MTLGTHIVAGQAGHIDDHFEIHTLMDRLDGQTEFLAAGVMTGRLEQRPTASAANLGSFFFASDVPALYASEGTGWVLIPMPSASMTLTGDVTHSGTVSFTQAGETTIDQEARHAVGGSGEPAFTNSWANSGTGGGGTFAPLTFWIDSHDVVHIEGTVTAGTATPVFTLPVGFRPPTDAVRFPVWRGNIDGTLGANTVHVCTVDTAGIVALNLTGFPITDHLSILGSFRVAA